MFCIRFEDLGGIYFFTFCFNRIIIHTGSAPAGSEPTEGVGGVSPPPSTFGPGTVLFEDDDIIDDDDDLEVGGGAAEGVLNGETELPPPSGLHLRQHQQQQGLHSPGAFSDQPPSVAASMSPASSAGVAI